MKCFSSRCVFTILMGEQSGSIHEIRQHFEAKLLQIVRRYHNDVQEFDMSGSVFDRTTGLDSLDLAEVFSWVEQSYGVSPIDDQGLRYETWEDLLQWIYSST